MYSAMMDPDLMRIAQEQMSRMSPADFARIQQQMMSNPDLMRMASESMQNMRPEDIKFAAEQLKHTHPEKMAEIGEKMAKVSPEEIASMQARLDAQVSYELSSALMLKKQGNELHNQGRYTSALEKYIRAKQILKDVPSTKGRDLILACSLNMMSCYLKTKQFADCIHEGTEVLTYEARNLKALYRRGQAYKELGKLEDAVSDLTKALEASPGEETIAEVLRDAKEKLMKEGGARPSEGLLIEEIIDEATTSDNQQDTRAVHAESQSRIFNKENSDQSLNITDVKPANAEYFESLKEDPESIRSFQDFISCTDPETLSALSRGDGEGLSPDMIRYASSAIGKMSPDEFRRMSELASRFHGDSGASNFTPGSTHPNLSPEMLKAASDVMNKMPPEDLEKMLKMAPLLHGTQSTSSASSVPPGNRASVMPNVTPDMIKMANEMIGKMPVQERQKVFEMASAFKGQGTTDLTTASNVHDSVSSSMVENLDMNENGVGEESSSRGSSSRNSRQPDFPSSADLEEQMRKQMKDPAMRQMLTSMVKNMSPETMANMSEQFGFKLSREEAEKAQQAMASLSPDALDTMMRWADRIQRGIEGARKTKNWLLGKSGMILAIAMLLLAVVLHWFGFIGK